MPELVDEFRHAPAAHPLWAEAWHFEVVAPDLSCGLYARLTLCPNLGHAWWWTVLVRAGAPMLLVRDQHLDVPRGFEVRGDGLWADLTCHDALQRWQVNFEGIAVALDDPGDAYGYERGDRVPVEFEFDWDATASPFALDDGYGQHCTVNGDADIVGSYALCIEGAAGYRQHTWGVVDYWSGAWASCEGEPIGDRSVEPKLEGGLLVDAPDGRTKPLRRALSTVAGKPAWAEWNPAPGAIRDR